MSIIASLTGAVVFIMGVMGMLIGSIVTNGYSLDSSTQKVWLFKLNIQVNANAIEIFNTLVSMIQFFFQ